MKKMKQFDDWLESSHISPKTAFKCHAGLEAAYRAGMEHRTGLCLFWMRLQKRSGRRQMSSYFINATEKSIIEELDRIIDWHIDNGKQLNKLVLSMKQSKQFTRLVKKAEKYDKL